ncbi:MAG: DUF115 domain-containing protein [Acholeplasmatales bacterium]|nr:DUF115 domain-containing protein [Acholeplasmatales bacterium]
MNKVEVKKRLNIILTKLHLLVIFKKIYNFKYVFRHRKHFKEEKKRRNGKNYNKFIKLKSLENVYLGKRCFIVATGPSLTVNDVELLSNEYTFGVNSIIKIFSKTSWRPTFYAIQDSKVYNSFKNDPDFISINNKFISDYVTEELKIKEEHIKFPLELFDHMSYGKKGKYDTKFSDNAYANVYDGSSITYSVMQIAYYMGFREIYLLGCDCNFSGDKVHFADCGYSYFSDNPEYRMIFSYNVALNFTKDHDLKIYNVTRGGKLEVFERKRLEDVLGGEK